ncbi:MAG: ABC transporter ATP-binding protein [Bacteroidetes bacterium]|nr:ABC transporter ATP-binding protein [Bacteroidota bacterium]MBK9554568.1 ABC transporter ATP-binding protein [Bacteroidota bacterium]MBL0282077.1 ABC transporter ATP-binding protein [Bacteroidota bacterium]
MRALKSVNKYLWRYRWLLLTGILFVGLANVFQVYAPRYIGEMIDLVTVNFDAVVKQNDTKLADDVYRGVLISGLLFLGFTILRGIFMFFMRQTIIVMSRNIEYDQKNDLFRHYEQLTPAFFKKNNTGDLMSRVAEDVGRVRQYVGPALMYFMNLVFNFLFGIWMMLSINPTLTMYVLLPLPVLSLSIYYVNSIINKRSEAIQAQLSHLTSVAQESFSGIRVIQAYAREKTTALYFEKECDEYKQLSLGLARVDALFQPLMVLLIGLSVLLTIFVGGWQVMEGKLSTGDLAEFLFYVNMMTWPVTSLGWVVSIIQRAAASQKRIDEFLNTQPDVTATGFPHHTLKGAIVFEDVHFTYPDTGVKALQGVSFSILPGEKIAIVGKTGSGKTTIADLMYRLYDVSSGQIRMDGIPIDAFNLFDLRKGISAVPQDVFLFSDSIKNNIAFGNGKTDMATVQQYAAYASIHDEITHFREGYDTLVGERGVTLSGGQKQRISIARAFLKDAPVIILDDCLSAVDTNTEKRIMSNMRDYLDNKTAIFITHRIFSLISFDKIIVLDNHTVAEFGTHDELMDKRGLYYQMFESQRVESATS